MVNLVQYLLDRIDEEQDLATADPAKYKDFPFFDWLEDPQWSSDRSYGGQRRLLQAHEEQLLLRSLPDHVIADCESRRSVVEACQVALTYAGVPGMEGAQVLAKATLRALGDRYAGDPELPTTV